MKNVSTNYGPPHYATSSILLSLKSVNFSLHGHGKNKALCEICDRQVKIWVTGL